MKLLMTLLTATVLIGCNGTVDYQKALDIAAQAAAEQANAQKPVEAQKPCPEVPTCPPEKVCPVCPVCPEVPVVKPVLDKELFLPAYNSDGSASVEYKEDAVQWTAVEKKLYGAVLNNAVRKVSARFNSEPCNDGSSCVAGLSAEEFFSEVCTELRSLGYRCGKHESWTDEICFGSPREKRCQGAHIFNYGGNLVAWAPGCMKDSDTWVWE